MGTSIPSLMRHVIPERLRVPLACSRFTLCSLWPRTLHACRSWSYQGAFACIRRQKLRSSMVRDARTILQEAIFSKRSDLMTSKEQAC